MTTVASLTIEMAANVARLQADMARAANTVQSATAKMQKAAETAGRALGAIGAGLTVAAFTGFIRSAINAADETSKLSQKIGVTVKDVAGLQLAFRQAGVSQEAMATGLARLSKGIAEGNDGLKSLGIATKNNDGTLKTSRQVLAEVADQFAKTGDGATKTARAQEIFGKTGADLIPLLNAGSEALDEYDRLASKLGLTLSDETAKQAEAFNDTLDLVGQGVSGVGRQIAAQLLPTLTGLASEFFNTVSSGDNLKKTADFLASALKGLYSAGVIGVEIFSSLGKTLGGVAAAVVAAVSGNFKQAGTIIGDLQSDVGAGWKDALAQVDRAWNSTGDNTVANLAQINKAQMTSTKSLEDGKKAAQEYAKFSEMIAGKVAELSGVNADYIKRLQELEKARRLGNVTEAQYIALVTELIAKQPSSIKLVKELAEAEKARIDAINESYAAELKRAEALEGTVEGLAEQNAALKNEIELIGLTERAQLAILQARNETIILTKEATLAELERASAITGTQTRIEIALQEEIRLLRERGELLGQKLDRTEAAKSYQNLQAEGKRFAEDLERGLTDSLFRAFEAGRGFFSTLWDGIKNLFKTTVLKLAIQGVVGGITGTAGSIASAASSAGGGGGLLGSLSNIGSLASLGGAFGSSLSAGFSASLSGGLGTLGLALEGGLASIATGTSTAIASGLGQIAGTLGPYALAAFAAVSILGSIFGSSKGATHFGGAYSSVSGQLTDSASVGSAFGISGGAVGDLVNRVNPEVNKSLMKLVESFTSASDNIKKVLGIDALRELTVGFAADASDKGKDSLGYFQLVNAIGEVIQYANRDLAKDPAQGFQQLTDDVANSVLAGLDKADIPAWADRILAGVGTTSGIQGLDAFTQQITAAVELQKSLQALPLAVLANVSVEASLALAQLSGGVESLAGNLDTYYTNFYTEVERTANTVSALTDAFGALGLQLPTTRDEFRALVDAQDVTTQAGQATVAALLQMAGTFASVVPPMGQLSNATGELAQNVASAADVQRQRLDLEKQVLVLQGDVTEIRRRELEAIFPANRALQEHIWALEDFADASREAAAEANRIAQERLNLEGQLLQVQGNTAAIRERELEALDETNRAIQLEIWATEDRIAAEAEAMRLREQMQRDAEESIRRAQQEQDAFIRSEQQRSQEIMRLREAEAAESQRRIEAEGAAFQRAMDERISLERQLLEAMGDTAAINALNREAIQEANRALYDQVQATRAATEAAVEQQRQLEAINNERLGLETRLLNLQGNTAELRRRELAALNPANRSILEQIYALEDQRAALDALNNTVETGGRSISDFESDLRNAYQNQADEISNVIDKNRELVKSLREYRNSLSTGPAALLSPEEAYRVAREALASATPDTARDLAEQFREASQNFNASGAAYFADLDSIKAILDSAINNAGATADVAQLQLDALTAQVSELISINESVLSVEEAISALTIARAPAPLVAPASVSFNGSSQPATGGDELRQLQATMLSMGQMMQAMQTRLIELTEEANNQRAEQLTTERNAAQEAVA